MSARRGASGCDWSHEIVIIDGMVTTVNVAYRRLCRGRMFYVRAYPSESHEMVFDAHDKAFAFFGGPVSAGSTFIAEQYVNPKPFTRTTDPDRMIAAVKRGHQMLDSKHQAISGILEIEPEPT